jgi:hypothetical protein
MDTNIIQHHFVICTVKYTHLCIRHGVQTSAFTVDESDAVCTSMSFLSYTETATFEHTSLVLIVGIWKKNSYEPGLQIRSTFELFIPVLSPRLHFGWYESKYMLGIETGIRQIYTIIPWQLWHTLNYFLEMLKISKNVFFK